MQRGSLSLLFLKNLLIAEKINTKQIISAKVSVLKGNSPDYLLKFKIVDKYKNLKIFLFLGGRLGSSHPIMKA